MGCLNLDEYITEWKETVGWAYWKMLHYHLKKNQTKKNNKTHHNQPTPCRYILLCAARTSGRKEEFSWPDLQLTKTAGAIRMSDYTMWKKWHYALFWM